MIHFPAFVIPPRRAVLIAALAAFLPAGGGALAQPEPLKDAPVPGWPALHVQTHYVARIAMRGSCLPVPPGKPIPDTRLNGCARPDFWRAVCDVYIDIDHVMSQDVYEHQVKRCRGYDYRNSDAFAEAWRVWRERGENRYADMLDFESIMFVWDPVPRCGAEDAACVEIR